MIWFLLQAPLPTDLSAEEEPLLAPPPPQPSAASADEGEGIDLSGVAAAIGQDANSAGTQVWKQSSLSFSQSKF